MSPHLEIRLQIPGKPEKRFRPAPGIYTIGAGEDNAIAVNADGVAWRHAVLGITPNEAWIEALPAGITTLDGKRVDGRLVLQPGQTLSIGPLTLTVEGTPSPNYPLPPSSPSVPPSPPEPAATQPSPAPVATQLPDPSPLERAGRDIRKQLHAELLARLDLKRLSARQIGERDLRERARTTIQQIVHDVRHRLPAGLDPDRLARELYDEAVGLGPLEDLLADPEVTEIMVNGSDSVYVERNGKLFLTGKTFLNDDSVLAIIERIVSPIGRRIDESQPFVDARLPDGSRVNAIIPPLSLSGPCLTIRKFSKTPYTIDDLIRFGTLAPPMADFLRACVHFRKNIVVSGGTGSGKTTFLNVLSSFLPADERIITIEDAAELRLMQRHVIRLEARPPNIEGRGAVTIRDLVRNALRMRPDRIVVGECRGGEALDMLQAMNTGHDGSLTTVHANSPRDVISRLETMVLMAGMDLPLRAIIEQIASAIHLIVHTARYADGTRKVSSITEICGLEGDQMTMQDLFLFEQTGISENGRVEGRFRPTGAVPSFADLSAVKGVSLDRRIFDPQSWTS